MASCLDSGCFSSERSLDELALGELRVPVPHNELERLRFLRETHLLDSQVNEDDYLRFTNLAARVLKVPIALVSLIDVSRQWFKARVGLDAAQTPRDDAFCSYAIMEREDDVFVVHNATQDPRFKENPLVLGHPHIRFYAGASFRLNRIKVGTLCVIDTVPRSETEFTAREKQILHDIAVTVGSLVEERHRRESEDKKILATRVLCGMDKSIAFLTHKKHAIERDCDALRHCQSLKHKAPLSGAAGTAETEKAGCPVSMLVQSVDDFALSLSVIEQQLEMRMKIAQSLFLCKKSAGDDASDESPKMSLCSFTALCASLKSFVPRLRAITGIQECSWFAPLLAFAHDTASQKMLSYPELFSLMLCQLTAHEVVCPGAAFDTLSLALETKKIGVKTNTRTHTPHEAKDANPSYERQSEGNILLSFAYRLAQENTTNASLNTTAVRLHNLSRTVQALEYLLCWVGGSLSVSVPVKDDDAFLIVVRLPFVSTEQASMEESERRPVPDAVVAPAAPAAMDGTAFTSHCSKREDAQLQTIEIIDKKNICCDNSTNDSPTAKMAKELAEENEHGGVTSRRRARPFNSQKKIVPTDSASDNGEVESQFSPPSLAMAMFCWIFKSSSYSSTVVPF